VVRARYTRLKIDEISSVDRPAQPGAVALLVKHDQRPPMAVFKDCAAAIQNRDGSSHTEAMRKARLERPAEFAALQGLQLEAAPTDPAEELLTVRATAQRDFFKTADLIRQRDGCSPSEAMSRARHEAPAEFAKAFL
jgi:hypothetical protein